MYAVYLGVFCNIIFIFLASFIEQFQIYSFNCVTEKTLYKGVKLECTKGAMFPYFTFSYSYSLVPLKNVHSKEAKLQLHGTKVVIILISSSSSQTWQKLDTGTLPEKQSISTWPITVMIYPQVGGGGVRP